MKEIKTAEEYLKRGIGILAFVPNPSDRDWTEDFEHENGNYQNQCIECKLYFNGHKRRVICKKCATPNWLEVSKKKRPEDTKDNKAWAGAWLEGEMVGYAKCMLEREDDKKLFIRAINQARKDILEVARDNAQNTLDHKMICDLIKELQ